MSAHTPGPWVPYSRLKEWVIYGGDGVASSANDDYPVCTAKGPDKEANARLIAAAPDLLAACDLAVFALESNGWAQDCPLTVKELRAAITKARA